MSQYDEFAVNYHWLYSDYVSSGKPYLEEHGDVLKTRSKGTHSGLLLWNRNVRDSAG